MLQKYLTPSKGVSRVVLAIALAGSCAFAQTEDTTTPTASTELPPVTVSAHDGVPVPVDEIGASVTVLDTEELRKEGVYTLAEALTRVPGAYVMPGGGLEGRGNISRIVIRGLNKEQHVMPVLDGMRLFNSSEIGLLSSSISGASNTFDISSLEVLRGSQAAVYGMGNMGGVLFMETPKGEGEPNYRLFTEFGTNNSNTNNATAQGEVGNLSYFVSTTYEATDNDLEYGDGSSATVGKAGEYSSWQEAVRLDYKINEKNTLSTSYRRVDSEYYTVNSDEYDTQSNLITASWRSHISDFYSTGIMMGYYSSDMLRASASWGDSYYEIRNFQMDWNNEFNWNAQNFSTAGISWNRNDGKYSQDARQNQYESVIGLYASHTYSPSKDWENSLNLRLDTSSFYDSNFSFRAASSYKFNNESTRVFGSVGTGYLAPTSFQTSDGVVGAWWQVYQGNPDLDVSTSLSMDLGIEQEIVENHKFSATLFWTQIYDRIEEDYVSAAPNVTFTNSDQVSTMQGIELALRGRFENTWKTGYVINYTLTQPKSSDDKQLSQTARQVWSADIHTSPTEKLTFGAGFSAAVGRVDFNSNRMDNYFVLRAYARYQVSENVSLHVRLENATDDQFVTNPGGGWGPDIIGGGAAVYAGCTVTF